MLTNNRYQKEASMWDIVITLISIIILVLLWVMLYDTNRFVITSHIFSDKRIRKAARAVVLADLHNKSYGKNNEKLLEAIAECKPDFILVAGDIPTAKPGTSLEVAIHLMQELGKMYPVYYGSGNHEHRLKLYPDKYGDMASRYEKALAEAGIHRLVNRHEVLEDCNITVYGSEIDRFYYKRFGVQDMKAEYLPQLLGQPSENEYTILLAHNPDYFPKYAEWGADLVCAGHVHGGMVQIPFLKKGVVSPNVRLFPKYDGGMFKEGRTTMLLSRGLGVHTIPVRLFNPGELLVVDFVPWEDKA
ncbi:MAG: metallophosphoesterase [Lachnospiraceae bacterium]|nr:metallophosphoesterase [Lachnospiraceae bacterium]